MIGPDSITTAEIRNGTIKGEDVTTADADGLAGANVKDGTLTQDDLAPNAVASSEIADGAIVADDSCQRLGHDGQTEGERGTLVARLPPVPRPGHPGLSGAVSGASADDHVTGGSHAVLVRGEAQFLGTPAGADVMTVSVQLFEGDADLARVQGPDHGGGSDADAPVWPDRAGGRAPGRVAGAHTYTLKLTASSRSRRSARSP